MHTIIAASADADGQAGIRSLSEAELNCVTGSSQSADPKQSNFYNSPSFRADYVLYPHTLMA